MVIHFAKKITLVHIIAHLFLPRRVAIQGRTDPYIVRHRCGVVSDETGVHVVLCDLHAIGVVHAAGPWCRDGDEQFWPLR